MGGSRAKQILVGPQTCNNDTTCLSGQFCNTTTHQCQDLFCPINQTAFNHQCQNCSPYDLNNNQVVDIFDVVEGLEHLSNNEKQIFNEGCSTRNVNTNKIELFDLLTLMSKILQ